MKHAFSILFVLLMWGCIKEERPSSEADIKEFAIEDINVLEVSINANSVYVMVSDGDWDSLHNVVPDIVLSAGASIEPPMGVAVNLHTDNIVVTAQDGISKKTYTFQPAKAYTSDTLRFGFENWSVTPSGFYALGDKAWSSGNNGIATALGILGRDPHNPENYPSQMTTEGKSGNAVKLVTTQGGYVFMNVAVWAGSFFLGNFNTAYLTHPLLATEFGRVYKRKPLVMQGWYKYTEGDSAYRHSFSNNRNTFIDHNRADSCSIYAVFYRADAEFTLNATNIDNAPEVIARTEPLDGSATQDNGFRRFTLNFRYRENHPPIDFENHTYKLAIVFSSSAGGGAPKPDEPNVVIYAGKIGSTLIVDEVEVINEIINE